MSNDGGLGFCPKCEAVVWVDDDEGEESFEPHDCAGEVTGDE